jgi:hypothetical protein
LSFKFTFNKTQITLTIDKLWWNNLLQYGKICSGYTWQHIFVIHVAFAEKGLSVAELMQQSEEFAYKNCFELYQHQFKQGLASYIAEPTVNFFEKIAQLDYLLIFRTGIDALMPLKPLKNLKIVYCYHNDIRDLHPLQDLDLLTELRCSYTRITNLHALKNLHHLEKLDFNRNKISDLSPLKELYALQVLDCSYNKIADVTPLQNLTNLTEITCTGNLITDLKPLTELRELRTLACKDNPIGYGAIGRFKKEHLTCNVVYW